MIYKTCLTIIALASAYLIYSSYDLYSAYAKASALEDGYYQTSDNADLRVVEFLSYNCIYCRQIHPTLQEALKRDGKITYIPRPIIMNDDEALYASAIVYNAGLEGKFMALHHETLEDDNFLNEDWLPAMVTKHGLNESLLDKSLITEDIAKKLGQNTDAFLALGGTGTPSFMIGDRIFYTPQNRMPSVEDFLRIFEEARNS